MLVQELSSLLMAIQNCKDARNEYWLPKHEERLHSLVKAHMPSGSGFDSETVLDKDRSTPNKLIFHTSFHHMDENGYYDGWTHHTVIVRPSLFCHFNVSVSGQNRNEIKDVIGEDFYNALTQEMSPRP